VTGRATSAGLGLVEVLVALGVLAVAVGALLALQAASLRASRSALVTRALSAAAEAESRLRSSVAAAGGACLVAGRWAVVADCRVEAGCAGRGCRVPLHRVTVTAGDGRELTVVGAGPLEAVLPVASPGGSLAAVLPVASLDGSLGAEIAVVSPEGPVDGVLRAAPTEEAP